MKNSEQIIQKLEMIILQNVELQNQIKELLPKKRQLDKVFREWMESESRNIDVTDKSSIIRAYESFIRYSNYEPIFYSMKKFRRDLELLAKEKGISIKIK